MVELEVVDVAQCGGCGGRHRFRVSVEREETARPRRGPETPEVEFGCFTRCPATGLSTWAVIRVADREAGRARLLRVSLANQDALAPSSAHQLPRGAVSNGRSDRSRVPELLRQTLGCPLYT